LYDGGTARVRGSCLLILVSNLSLVFEIREK
jgi:hypothetical protein